MLQLTTPAEIEALTSLRIGRSRRGVIIVLTAYGDESSDETHQRVFAVGALFGSREQWDALQVKWLERTGGLIFHAAECDSDNGAFAQFSHEENKKLYKDLTILLAESKLLGYGVALDLISQNRDMGRELLPESPYYRYFGEVVVFFAEKAYLSIPREPVEFIFDRRMETEHSATELYFYLANLPEWEHQPYIHDRVAFATRKTAGIQIADLWTREVMKHLDNEIGPEKRPERLSMTALKKTRRFGATIYTGDWFKGLEERIKELDNLNTGTATAFGHGRYKKWLQEHGLTDAYGVRMRYLAQYDAEQRAKGNATHFDDVRMGRSL
jgi:hypothetical protein